MSKLSKKAIKKLEQLAEIRNESLEDTKTFVLETCLHQAGTGKEREPNQSTEEEALCFLWGLNPDHLSRLKRLAQIRGEDLVVMGKVLRNAVIKTIPRQLPDSEYFLDFEFEEIGTDENNRPFVRLPDGTVFYNDHSPTKYRNLYYLLKDKIDRRIRPETYVMGVDVLNRYFWRGTTDRWLPGEGGVIVEAGAYVGFKAIRFARHVGNTGKVIAVEINKSNFEILQKNIEANSLERVVMPFWCGVWKTKGVMEARSGGYTYHTLAESDNHKHLSKCSTVPTDTLDNIIDKAGVERVDYINFQLNGAEVEALEGLERRLNDVKILRIASYYSHNGVKKADQVCDILNKRNCKIISRSKLGSIIATSPRFKHLF